VLPPLPGAGREEVIAWGKTGKVVTLAALAEVAELVDARDLKSILGQQKRILKQVVMGF